MKRLKKSVREKMILLSVISIFSTVILCLLLNDSFLVRYYERNKQKTLGKTFSQINRLMKENEEAMAENESGDVPEGQKPEVAQQIRQKMDILCARYNITTVIVQGMLSKEEILYYYGAEGEENTDRIVRELIGDYFLPGIAESIQEKKLERKTDEYNIYSLFDSRMQSKYIELVGVLEDGSILLMRTDVESMQESVKIANRFLLYVGTISAVLFSVLMAVCSGRFAKKLRKLSEIANQMTKLNFDVKYKVRDMDEIGELGGSLNDLSGKLEATITELKAANNELQKDIEKKTQIDEMRKEFLSNVTHELKTPIALIQGYAEGLKDNINESREEREFYCDVIIDEAAKMNEMVKKLLTLNRLEFGTANIEMTRFDVNELICNVLHSIDILAKQKEVTLYYEPTGTLDVWADEYMTEEVLTNYLSNAINHAQGSKIVEVKTIPMEKCVRVAVFNTGDPIPDEEIPKLWDKFYKVDKARTREYGGSGIGLSIVKAIMEAHNQGYGVRNHETGAEFWFELDNTAKIEDLQKSKNS